MGNFISFGRRRNDLANSKGINCYTSPLLASHESDQPPSVQPDKAILVPLGHMAFLAYDDPVLEDEDRCQTTKKPTVFFMDRYFLKKRCYGLQVRLTTTSPQPKTYVILSVESKLFKAHSRTIRLQAGINNSTDPAQQDAKPAYFVVGHPGCDVLHVKLYDGRRFCDPRELKLNVLPTNDGVCTFHLEGSDGTAANGYQLHVRLLTWSSANYTEEDVPQELTSYNLQGDKDPKQQEKSYFGRSKSVANSTANLAVVSAISATSATTPSEVSSESSFTDDKPLTAESKDFVVIANCETLPIMEPAVLGAHDHVHDHGHNDAVKLHSDSFHDLCHAMDGNVAEDHGAVAFVECLETDTQVWVFWNEESRQVTLAFRGTEKWRDWRTNFRFLPVHPHWLLSPNSRPNVPGLNRKHIKTHYGFLSAYNSVRDTVHALVKHITTSPEEDGEEHPWRAFVTGHSLGGALANLAAYDLSLRKWEHEQDGSGIGVSAVTLYTFGCPRVGNRAFATDLNDILPDAWRVNNTNDIVSSVPRKLWGYYHAGKNLEMKNGELKVMGNDVSKGIIWKLLSLCFVTEHLGPMYQSTLQVLAGTFSTCKSVEACK